MKQPHKLQQQQQQQQQPVINTRMVYINNGEHDSPHELPKDNFEGSLYTMYHDYTHTDIPPKVPEEIEELEYIYCCVAPLWLSKFNSLY